MECHENFKFVWITQTNRFEFVWKLFWKINDELHLQFILMFVFSPCSHYDFSWTLSIVCVSVFLFHFARLIIVFPITIVNFTVFRMKSNTIFELWLSFDLYFYFCCCCCSNAIHHILSLDSYFFPLIFWYDYVSVTVLTWFFSVAMFLDKWNKKKNTLDPYYRFNVLYLDPFKLSASM